MAKSERDEVRDRHAADPGVGHHVERLLNERQTAVDYGMSPEHVEGIDRQLGEFGHTARAKAAADRRAARSGSGDKAKRTPPAGRSGKPAQST